MGLGRTHQADLLRACSMAAAIAAMSLIVGASQAQTWQNLVDYTKLYNRLGSALPNGAGGALSIVEGTNTAGGSYFNVASSEFTAGFDPFATAVNVVNGSAVSTSNISMHANGVASQFFGNIGSMAAAANQVTHYEAGNWLQNFIGYNTSIEPIDQPFRVQNHSYIVTTLGSDSQDVSALRRFDYLIDKNEMTAVVGANNATTSILPHPRLLVHSYNAIVVGRSDGLHSRGTTNSVYGSGRFKPDIVAYNPASATASRATAMVSSAAALLHQSVVGTDAAKNETMKAILLAGATKAEFASFTDPLTSTANGWDRTPTRPLDDIFGAGELNVYNSYLVQLGGQHGGVDSAELSTQAPVSSFGWDYRSGAANATGADVYYNFEVAKGSIADELSIILAWDAKITNTAAPGSGNFTPVDSLQNLDLHFYESTDGVLGSLLDMSVSTVDNVEHIYLKNLAAGEYTLKVSGAANWDYGLAWRTATRFEQVSADFNEDGAVDGTDFLVWQQNIGKLINATHAQGDADGDGDVDEFDLQAVRDAIAAANEPPMEFAANGAAVAAIPEPATIALFVAAAGLLALAHRGLGRRRGTVPSDAASASE